MISPEDESATQVWKRSFNLSRIGRTKMPDDMHLAPAHRRARLGDLPALQALTTLAIGALLEPWLDAAQIEASRAIMGVDSQLVRDGTYFVVEYDGPLAGCGGWSRRATLMGGDHTAGRDARLLDPAREPARVRAMYTHPGFTRRGIGRKILTLCESAARAEGFARAELIATLAGEPLFRACGYRETGRFEHRGDGVPVPLLRMAKTL
jgi:GNAT superfamily N-acetyltransferase